MEIFDFFCIFAAGKQIASRAGSGLKPTARVIENNLEQGTGSAVPCLFYVLCTW